LARFLNIQEDDWDRMIDETLRDIDELDDDKLKKVEKSFVEDKNEQIKYSVKEAEKI